MNKINGYKVGDKVRANGYKATVVAYRPELGGYVVAMSGEDEPTPGEQFVVVAKDLEKE
jgi:hypothetical protein